MGRIAFASVKKYLIRGVSSFSTFSTHLIPLSVREMQSRMYSASDGSRPSTPFMKLYISITTRLSDFDPDMNPRRLKSIEEIRADRRGSISSSCCEMKRERRMVRGLVRSRSTSVRSAELWSPLGTSGSCDGRVTAAGLVGFSGLIKSVTSFVLQRSLLAQRTSR